MDFGVVNHKLGLNDLVSNSVMSFSTLVGVHMWREQGNNPPFCLNMEVSSSNKELIISIYYCLPLFSSIEE